jgi:hypothetical protein
MSETFFGSQHPPKPQCDGNHFRLFVHHLCTAREPSQVMARIAVVVLNVNCVGLADDMAFGRQNFGKSTPIILVKRTAPQVFHFAVESPERCSITTAEYPCHGSPCATIKGFDDPKPVFFEPTKCHISSNSISRISPVSSVWGVLAPASTIQRYASDGHVSNSFANMLNEALPRECKSTHMAFFAAIFSFVLSSPSTKL